MASPTSQPPTAFQARRESLQRRVNDAAKALSDQGVRPTVARVRSALGGGSPNDLAPALKQWRDSVLPTISPGSLTSSPRPTPLPLQVADLAHELWQRARAAAVLETKGGQTARDAASRTAEAQALREQLTSVRDQLQRESLAYGELRAQAARHEAIARDALTRVRESDARERRLLRELGSLRQRVSELEAAMQSARGIRRSPSPKTQTRNARKLRSSKPTSATRKPSTGRVPTRTKQHPLTRRSGRLLRGKRR